MIASTTFRALGTSATVAVTDAELLDEAHELLAQELVRLDQACSRFNPDSELLHVNAFGGRTTEVGPLLAEALAVAIDAAESTGGLVTPTLGTALARAGYDRTFELVRARSSWTVRPTVPRSSAWREIELDRERGTLRIPRGVELDLGATAKAFAADRAAASIAAATGSGVLVSLGGDVAVAGRGPATGWIVRIADDHEAPLEGVGPLVAVSTGGIATSSTVVRRWRTDDGEAHHVIDPRTARPARTPWRTVSVSAATCVDANVGALGALLLAARAPAWLERRGLHARLVREDGAVTYTGSWPADAEAA